MLQNDFEEYDGDAAEAMDDAPRHYARPRRRWNPMLLLFVFLALLAGTGAAWYLFGAKRIAYNPSTNTEIAPPPPIAEAMDQRLRPLTKEEAVIANAEILQSKEPIEPAKAFIVPFTEAMTFSRSSASDCMTAAIFYEAASESEQGQRGVAQVILNRVRHPAFPKSVCEVVFQGSQRTTGCQFSFTCDGSLARKPSQAAWDRARRIADASLSGAVEPSVGMATHYHTIWILPYWAPTLDKITTVGAHIFYRWKGYWGKRSAFVGAYTGETMDPALDAMPTDVMQGATGGLLLGTGATGAIDNGGTLIGPAGQRPAPLLPDLGGSRLNHAETPGSGIKADEARQRPSADDATGVLVGPGSGGATGP
jgi:spore germination cell wall hydrolase CwlJ-like protein